MLSMRSKVDHYIAREKLEKSMKSAHIKVSECELKFLSKGPGFIVRESRV